ncbi:MAG: hypothetical protein J6Q85_03270 [Clostridia bacterium]|nr:hypothetical protein [Clostridia bacterium]
MNIKRIITFFVSSLFTLFALPILALNLLRPIDVLGGLLGLMFTINPLVSVWLGALSGKDIRHLWWFSPTFSILFLLGFWLSIGQIVLDLTIYACIYMVLGLVSLVISNIVCSKINSKNQKQNLI